MSRRVSLSRRGRGGGNHRPLLVFFSAWRSGPARRMESLLAHIERKEQKRLRVTRVDIERHPGLASRFHVREIPTLILVKGQRAVARFEGRAKASDIAEFVEPHLPDEEAGGSAS